MPSNRATIIAPITTDFDQAILAYLKTYPNRFETKQELIRYAVASYIDFEGILHYSTIKSEPNHVRSRDV